MESLEEITKSIKVEQGLNKPQVGQRYLYCRDTLKSRLKEGWVLEISTSGYWIKMFNGKVAEWIHFEGFGVFEILGDCPFARRLKL